MGQDHPVGPPSCVFAPRGSLWKVHPFLMAAEKDNRLQVAMGTHCTLVSHSSCPLLSLRHTGPLATIPPPSFCCNGAVLYLPFISSTSTHLQPSLSSYERLCKWIYHCHLTLWVPAKKTYWYTAFATHVNWWYEGMGSSFGPYALFNSIGILIVYVKGTLSNHVYLLLPSEVQQYVCMHSFFDTDVYVMHDTHDYLQQLSFSVEDVPFSYRDCENLFGILSV